MTQSADRPGQTGSARPVFDPVQLVDADVYADVAADVATDVGDDVGHDVMMTSSLTRLRSDPTDPDIDLTRSTTRTGH